MSVKKNLLPCLISYSDLVHERRFIFIAPLVAIFYKNHPTGYQGWPSWNILLYPICLNCIFITYVYGTDALYDGIQRLSPFTSVLVSSQSNFNFSNPLVNFHYKPINFLVYFLSMGGNGHKHGENIQTLCRCRPWSDLYPGP